MDDAKIALMMEKTMLTQAGYDLVIARDGMEAVAELTGELTTVCIDISTFKCCAPGSLQLIRKWLNGLQKQECLFGALVGPESSLGTMQLQRAIRESGVADAFMRFRSIEEAKSFLADVG